MIGWITFWKWACIVGIGSFFVMVLFVIPFGAADIVKLFKHLKAGGDRASETDETR